MARREYGHEVGPDGRVRVVETTLPRHLRGLSEYDTTTIVEGPLTRLFSRKKGKR
nr:hypothetical protein [Micromonospora sp. DSM 115978]